MQNEYSYDIPTFKIRCSAIGSIMTEPQGKSIQEKIEDLKKSMGEKENKCAVWEDAGKTALKTYVKLKTEIPGMKAEIAELELKLEQPNLSRTCITYLEKWVKEKVYKRRIEFTSKYTDKGNIVEQDAMIYAAGYVPEMGLISKNIDRYTDDFVEGEPDLLTDEYVFDNKASWSFETFPVFENIIPESDYDWQVQGYMKIAKRAKGRVVFVLMSMPEELIVKEARYKLGYEYTSEQYHEFADKYRYDTLPAYLRIKEFEVLRDEAKHDAIEKRVLECRWYIENMIVPELEKNAKKYPE